MTSITCFIIVFKIYLHEPLATGVEVTRSYITSDSKRIELMSYFTVSAF